MATIVFQTLLIFVWTLSSISQEYSLVYQTPSSCQKGLDTVYHEYYDVTRMSCLPCAQNRTFQTVSANGLSCVCQKRFKIKQLYKYDVAYDGQQLLCEPCPTNQVTSSDGWTCVTCDSYDAATQTCRTCTSLQIRVSRDLNGSPSATQACLLCTNNTSPQFGKCSRCDQVLAVIPTLFNCQCPAAQTTGSLCFAAEVMNDDSTLYRIPTLAGGEGVESAFFKENLRAAWEMCQPAYGNQTACQTLANMCVLHMYSINQQAVCRLYQETSGAKTAYGIGEKQDAPSFLPWLYFDALGNNIIDSSNFILALSVTMGMQLEFLVARYSLEGQFLGLSPITGGLLQICTDMPGRLNAAYTFGTTYAQTCEITALQLFDKAKYPLEFYDMYLQYTENDVVKLYTVPLLITDYRDTGNKQVNAGTDTQLWQLVRRFFMVDNVATVSSDSQPCGGGDNSAAQTVRYMESLTLVLRLKTSTGEGTIYPPYFKMTYGEVSCSDATNDAKVTVTFNTEYSMPMDDYLKSFQIATGTLSVLAVLFSGYRTWVWSKRAGRFSIDFISIINFVFFCAASLSNTFFVITFGTSFYWLVFFKIQATVLLIYPTGESYLNFEALLGLAFSLKCLQLIHIIYMQSTADIFLIDWERPKGTSGTENGKKGGEGTPVSIWRTYFVANEWNEIQTTRKVNSTFLIFTVVLFLEVIGFKNVSTLDPNGTIYVGADEYKGPQSPIYRFAVTCLVFLLVALAQWVLVKFIYERFIENRVQQFVDLCSMSNISVFVMAHAQYGFYIHGRSVHGKADTDMKQMHEMMKREEEDLCGQRGLMPNTDTQTFEMSLPYKLRNRYDHLYLPVALQQGMQSGGRTEGGRPGSKITGTATEQTIHAYLTMNKFLSAFIDHSLRDLDYVVKDKTILESILDTEFLDSTEKGIFYNDNGHAFDQVLFCGNEVTLILFDLLFFSIIDLLATNYILAGVLTYLVAQFVKMIRNSAGKKNLARKTLVDDRFLI